MALLGLALWSVPGFHEKVASGCSSDLLVESEAGRCAASQGTRGGAWHRLVMSAVDVGGERA